MSETVSLRWRRLLELLVFAAAGLSFSKLVSMGLAHIGVALPEMPLLHYAYLSFGFTLASCAYLVLRGEKLSDFAFAAPKRLWILIGRGVLVFLVIMIFDIIGRPLLDPLIQHLTGADPHRAAQHFASVKGNIGLLLYLVPVAWLFAAFGEEIFYRGIIMTRAAQVLGGGRAAWIAALFIQALPFALGHAYQGPVGMVAVYVVALLYGTGTLIWGRNLWPAIIAHGLQDTFGFVMLYAGLVSM